MEDHAYNTTPDEAVAEHDRTFGYQPTGPRKVTGKLHDYEPEADALSFIDFEDCREEFDSPERRSWMMQAADAVAGEVTASNTDRWAVGEAFNGILRTLGEVAAWKYLGEIAMAQGFDVYDSDGRFEVFEGGTPEYGSAEVYDHEKPGVNYTSHAGEGE